jgi:hypothetical protein
VFDHDLGRYYDLLECNDEKNTQTWGFSYLPGTERASYGVFAKWEEKEITRLYEILYLDSLLRAGGPS